MFPLIPNEYHFDGVRLKAITRHDLVKAHHLAPELVLAISRAEGRYSRAQALNLVVAALLPLIGYLFLGWSVLFILLALVLDYATTWIGDRLKRRWDPQLVEAEISRAADAEMAFNVAIALKYPARLRRAIRDEPGRRVLVCPVQLSDQRSLVRGNMHSIMMAFLSIVLPLVFLPVIILFRAKQGSDAAAFMMALMLIPVLVNLGVARYQSIHAAVDGTPNPQLYPQATTAFTVLFCGSVLFGILEMLVSVVTGSSFLEGQDRRLIGGIYLSCFLGASACVAVISQRRIAEWSRVLKEFSDTSRTRLMATLATFNPDARHVGDGD